MITATRPKLRPKNYESIFSTLEPEEFTPQEEKVIELLRHVSTDSFYGMVIRDCFIDKTVKGMRDLFATLLSQLDDNESMMFRILGYEAFTEIQKLK